MVSTYTGRIKDEQTFRSKLTKTMKVAHVEQTSIVRIFKSLKKYRFLIFVLQVSLPAERIAK